jgi:predicted GNAT family N-acyltransferase
MLSPAFRPAMNADLPTIVALKLVMSAEAGLAQLLVDDADRIIFVDYEQLYRAGHAQHFVVEQDGQLVAMVGAFLKSDLPFRYYKTPIYGFIGDVYTQPCYRQQRLAKRLNEQALLWLKAQGIQTVRLSATDAARTIYEVLGFKPSDEMVLHLHV